MAAFNPIIAFREGPREVARRFIPFSPALSGLKEKADGAKTEFERVKALPPIPFHEFKINHSPYLFAVLIILAIASVLLGLRLGGMTGMINTGLSTVSVITGILIYYLINREKGKLAIQTLNAAITAEADERLLNAQKKKDETQAEFEKAEATDDITAKEICDYLMKIIAEGESAKKKIRDNDAAADDDADPNVVRDRLVQIDKRTHRQINEFSHQIKPPLAWAHFVHYLALNHSKDTRFLKRIFNTEDTGEMGDPYSDVRNPDVMTKIETLYPEDCRFAMQMLWRCCGCGPIELPEP